MGPLFVCLLTVVQCACYFFFFSQTAFLHFQELDDHINNVATKVVHLGDQLEGVNTPRARAEEAQKLIGYFTDFLDDLGPTSDVFNDPFRVSELPLPPPPPKKRAIGRDSQSSV